jgi:hypothetical protein
VPAAVSGRGIPGGGEEVRYLLFLLLSSSEWEKEPESELLSGGLPPRLVRRLLRDGSVPDRWVRLRGSGVDSAIDLCERLLRFGGGEASCGSLLSLSELGGSYLAAPGFAGGDGGRFPPLPPAAAASCVAERVGEFGSSHSEGETLAAPLPLPFAAFEGPGVAVPERERTR